MQNSLNLVGDGDDVDVVRDVERTFGISITNKEAEATLTVGQLYDLIQAKCGVDRAEACFSQMAFYRLRRAFNAPDSKTVITTDTPVSILRHLGAGSIAQKWKELGRRSGLSLPSLETPFSARLPSVLSGHVPLGMVALFCAAASAFALTRHFGFGPGSSFWMAAIGVPVLSVAALTGLHVIFRDIPQRIATVGDLAREAAGYSFAELRRTKPAPSALDRWYALTAILRQISGHKPPISRDTTFFPS